MDIDTPAWPDERPAPKRRKERPFDFDETLLNLTHLEELEPPRPKKPRLCCKDVRRVSLSRSLHVYSVPHLLSA